MKLEDRSLFLVLLGIEDNHTAICNKFTGENLCQHCISFIFCIFQSKLFINIFYANMFDCTLIQTAYHALVKQFNLTTKNM
ncbi:hypothetical protein RIR_jg3418.t1 [Rhizophagus irregularis DAOM 181602=DAOM 197198]|nr:hypothetical protein RIR_jg3418.t1 [Rhizophagus irregularis DAOM 181602=DAOM 197198]CAB5179431.1 unnamed protein product [Rhizophagus irregularis]